MSKKEKSMNKFYISKREKEGKIYKSDSLGNIINIFKSDLEKNVSNQNIFYEDSFYNWSEIVGDEFAKNSNPLFVDKNGQRLVVVLSHGSFQVSIKFLNNTILEQIKKNKGCENVKEIKYVTRPDLFKDKYEVGIKPKTSAEKNRINKIIMEIKNIISLNE